MRTNQGFCHPLQFWPAWLVVPLLSLIITIAIHLSQAMRKGQGLA